MNHSMEGEKTEMKIQYIDPAPAAEVTPPVQWTRELNMPPAEWFQGEWFMQRRLRELKASEDARQAKRDRLKKIVAEVVLQIVGGIGFIGAICGYVALLWLMR